MKKSDLTPPHIQKLIDAKERLLQARALAEGENQATERFDAMHDGKSSFRDEADTKELNSWMSP